MSSRDLPTKVPKKFFFRKRGLERSSMDKRSSRSLLLRDGSQEVFNIQKNLQMSSIIRDLLLTEGKSLIDRSFSRGLLKVEYLEEVF